MKRYKSVDAYIESAEYWQEELRELRKILRSTELEETTKWGGPATRSIVKMWSDLARSGRMSAYGSFKVCC